MTAADGAGMGSSAGDPVVSGKEKPIRLSDADLRLYLRKRGGRGRQ